MITKETHWYVLPIGCEKYIEDGKGLICDMARNLRDTPEAVRDCDVNGKAIASLPQLAVAAAEAMRWFDARNIQGGDAHKIAAQLKKSLRDAGLEAL